MQEKLDAAETPLHLADPGNGPDGVQDLGRHLFDVLSLGHREDQSIVGAQGRFNSTESTRTPRPDWRSDTGKQYDLTKRQDRKFLPAHGIGRVAGFSVVLVRIHSVPHQEAEGRLDASAVPYSGQLPCRPILP